MGISRRRHRKLCNAAMALERSSVIEKRKRQLDGQVSRGERDAGSLVAIPLEMALKATLTFPDNPFGAPQPW